jgi:molecular chaperone GrpE
MAGKKKCKKCEEEAAALKAQLEEMTEQAKRAMADLTNFKRRTEEDQHNFVAFALNGVMTELLPILDSLQRAIQHIPEDSEAGKEFGKGIIQISDHFQTALQKNGLAEINAQPGTPFDPNFHEALLQGEGKKDVILEEFEKGYMLGERVLRPAKVKVGV